MPPLSLEALRRIAAGLPAFGEPAEPRLVWCKVERCLVPVDDLRQRRLAIDWLYRQGYVRREPAEIGYRDAGAGRGHVGRTMKHACEVRVPRVTDAGRMLLGQAAQPSAPRS